MVMTKIINKPNVRKLPRWIAEHVELDMMYEGIFMYTLENMEKLGRVKNILRVDHIRKHFVQFERRSSLKFKRIRNV